jgi:PilZ domain
METAPQPREFRRRPRSRVSCPVTVEAGNRILHGETLNLGPCGAKLRLDERLQEGTSATLHFTPAVARPMDVEAIVWRSDDDGSVFFFLRATPADLQPSQ